MILSGNQTGAWIVPRQRPGRPVTADPDADPLVVFPFDPDALGVVGLDVHLGPMARVPAVDSIDTAGPAPGHTDLVTATVIPPGGFLLAATLEHLRLPMRLVGRIHGLSGLGRLGLGLIAGSVAPGFSGQLTLGLVNHAQWSLTLHPGMPIARVVFGVTDGPGSVYSGAYQNLPAPAEGT